MVWGLRGGGVPPFLDFVFKIKVRFWGFEVEKRKFSVVAYGFGCIQFK